MHALELTQFNRLEVVERPDPTVGNGEVIVDIAVTGICGSDIHGYTGDNGRRIPGQVMGHETVGHISALGHETEAFGLEIGQVVTFNPLMACDKCEACAAGEQQHCPDRRVIGVNADIVSAFAQQVAVPAVNIVPLNPDNPISYGALIEPLAVAFHAVRRAGVKEGDAVLVAGGGPIGQSCVLAALHEGAGAVLVSELDPNRRELCERLGATAIDPSEAELTDQVVSAFGRLADVGVDAVGISPTMAGVLDSVRFGGTVVLVGMGSPELSVQAFKISTEERTIVGSFCYNNQDFRDAAAWVDQGSPALAALITREVAMEEADEAFRSLATGDGTPGKVLVRLSAKTSVVSN